MLTEHIESFKLYKRHKRVPLSKIHLMMQKTTIGITSNSSYNYFISLQIIP